MGGKYVVSCIARAASSSSSFLLDSTAPGDDPDADGLTYPEPVFLHFTDGQPLILLDVGNLKYLIFPRCIVILQHILSILKVLTK
jgi:hypothetical protein